MNLFEPNPFDQPFITEIYLNLILMCARSEAVIVTGTRVDMYLFIKDQREA